MAVNYRIGKLGGGIAIFIALLIDLAQLALNFLLIGGFLNPFIVSPVVYASFWWWFRSRGVKFSDPKNITTLFIGSLIELIPYVNSLPGLTVMVAKIILNSRVDDIANSGGVVGTTVKKGRSLAGKNYGEALVTSSKNTGPKNNTRPKPTNIASAPSPYRKIT